MKLSYRSAGRSAITSGVIGILAYAFLLGFLIIRKQDAQNDVLPIRVHDACVILQFLFLIPVVSAVVRLIQERSLRPSQPVLYSGIGSLSFTILFVLLIFPKFLADTLYMFPQGIFGIWLMVACWRLNAIIPQWLRWLGLIVGFGLTLVGLFPLGYAIFVDPVMLHIPALSDEVMDKIPTETPANIFIHQLLYIGSFTGVLILPIWTILFGVRLVRQK